jgi:hypothetical protein
LWSNLTINNKLTTYCNDFLISNFQFLIFLPRRADESSLLHNEGRARTIRAIEPGAAAIIDIFLSANFGADALAHMPIIF